MLLGRMFKLPARREQNFIAGLSMGGYGALFLGLSRPDLYAGCASFSGAVDLSMMLADPAAPGVREVFGPVFGDGLLLPKSSDLFEKGVEGALYPLTAVGPNGGIRGLPSPSPLHLSRWRGSTGP